MFARDKDILALQSEVDSLRGQLFEHKRVLLETITCFRDSYNERLDEIENTTEELTDSYNQVTSWDDETREKFRALEKHLGIEISKKFKPDVYTITELSDDERNMELF